MNRWMWQAITEIAKKMVDKGQYGKVTLIFALAIGAPVLLAALGLFGSYLGVKTGLGM
jgi:hypothetical protein